MSRILVIIIITLSCYLGYNQFINNEADNEIVVEERKDESKVEKAREYKKFEEHIDLDTGVDISAMNYFGIYSQERKTDTFEAELVVEIIDETNYAHKRIVTRDGSTKESEIKGNYKVINGSVLQLIYPEDRDKATFPTPKALFTLEEDGSLSSGDWKLIKE